MRDRHDVVALWAVCGRDAYDPALIAAWPNVRDALPEALEEWMREAIERWLDYCPDGDPLWFDTPAGRWAFATSSHVLEAPTLDELELEELRGALEGT